VFPVISDFLPIYHIDNVHSIKVNSNAAHAFKAFQELTIAEIPVIGLLIWLRLLPGRLLRRHQVFEDSQRINQPLLNLSPKSGSILLSKTMNKQIVLGFIGSFWTFSPSFQPLSSAHDFSVFNAPNNVKVAMQFSVHEKAKDTEVKIQTRIFALDAASKRKMIVYWGIIKCGIWIFRKSWLLVIKRRAESYY
jgi:hypothetical protein